MKNRINFLDNLRIISCIAVIILHTITYGYYSAPFLSPSWTMCTIINCLSRFCVPVFVGISGALFLSRDINIKDLYRKYILRIVLVFLLCSTFYAIWDCFYDLFEGNAVKVLFEKIIKGHYHLWYLYLVITLYGLTPILRKIVVSDKILKYTLILLFLTQFIFPSVFNNSNIQFLSLIINKISFFNDTLGYVFYYLLGYYICTKEVTRKKEIISYVIGILGFVITCFLTLKSSINERVLIETNLKSLTINIAFQYIGVFVFAKCRLNNKNRTINKQLIEELSACSFGVYLCHPFVLDKTYDFCVLLGINNIYIRLFIMFVVTTTISFYISHIYYLIKNVGIHFNHQ